MTATEAASIPRAKLPVLGTAWRTWAYLVVEWRFLTLPFVVLFLFNFLVQHFMRQGLLVAAPVPGNARLLIFDMGVLSVLIQASFVVGVHRTILLGEARNGITFFRLDMNWLRYIGA